MLIHNTHYASTHLVVFRHTSAANRERLDAPGNMLRLITFFSSVGCSKFDLLVIPPRIDGSARIGQKVILLSHNTAATARTPFHFSLPAAALLSFLFVDEVLWFDCHVDDVGDGAELEFAFCG